MTDLVSVAVFPADIEADLARGALEAAGIFAVVASDDAGQEIPGLDFSRGVAVMVRPEDLDAAQQLLKEAEEQTFDSE